MSNPPEDSKQRPAFVAVRDLPIEAFGDRRGRQTRKFILTTIVSHANNTGGGAWPSQQTIAEETGVDPRTVRRVIRWLKDHRFLDVAGHSHWVGERKMVNSYTVLTRGHSVPARSITVTAPEDVQHPPEDIQPSHQRTFSTSPEDTHVSSNHQVPPVLPQKGTTSGAHIPKSEPQKQNPAPPQETPNFVGSELWNLVGSFCVAAGIWDGEFPDENATNYPDTFTGEGIHVVYALTKKLLPIPIADLDGIIPQLVEVWLHHKASGLEPRNPAKFFAGTININLSSTCAQTQDKPAPVQMTLTPQPQENSMAAAIAISPEPVATVVAPAPTVVPRKQPTTFADFVQRVTLLHRTIRPKSFHPLTTSEQGQLTALWGRHLRSDATYARHFAHVWPVGFDTTGNLQLAIATQEIADQVWPIVAVHLVRLAHDWNPTIQSVHYTAPAPREAA